jgi:hypothetical protein
MSTQRRLLLTTLLLQLAILSVHYWTPSTRAQKSRIQSAEYTTPSLRLTADRNVVPACEGETKTVVVILNANPGWPQGTFARYRWTTEVGHIEGAGPNVRWDLTGVRPGRYRVYVESETGTEGRTCQVSSSTSVLLECRPVQPPICPTISILGPQKILAGQPVTFVSVLTSNASAVKPVYRWAVSAGKIIQGQGTDSIRVDTTDLEGQTITARVSLTGYTVDCSATASLDVPVVQTCRRFDEFPLLTRNDEKARLDNFTIEMQRDPSSTSYVIIYPGQREDTRQIRTRSKAIVDYLVNSRKIDAERIVTRTGPLRDRLTIELWSCPRGIEPR